MGRLMAALAIGTTGLVSGAQPAAAAATADGLAAAIAGPGIAVSGASFVVSASQQAVQVRTDSVAGFPIDAGGSYAAFSTGDAAELTLANDSGSTGTSLGAPSYRDTFDTTTLKIDFAVQPGFNCLSSIKFRFLSEEFPEFVGTQYNDALIIELDTNGLVHFRH